MKVKCRDIKKSVGGGKKTRGRLREFKEEEVAWALAGEDGDKLRAEPLASALSELDLRVLPKRFWGCADGKR